MTPTTTAARCSIPVEEDLECPFIVSFALQGDFNTLLPDQNAQNALIQDVIAYLETLGIDASRLQNFVLKSGSIVVTFDLLPATSGSSLDSLVAAIKSAVSGNNVSIQYGANTLAAVTVCAIF